MKNLNLFENNLKELRTLYKERSREIIEFKMLKKFPAVSFISIILFSNSLFFVLYPVLKMGRLLIIAHGILAIFSVFYYFNLKHNYYQKKLKEYKISGLTKYFNYFSEEKQRHNILFSIKSNINNLNLRIIELHKQNKELLKDKNVWAFFLNDINIHYDKYYSFLVQKNKFNILLSQFKNNFNFIDNNPELNKIKSIIDTIKEERSVEIEKNLSNDMIKSF